METLEKLCILADECKLAGTESCNITCYPYVLAHGIEKGGFLNATGIPPKFRRSFLHNIPIKEENPAAYAIAEAYIKDIMNFVKKGVGLFLYSVPNTENPRGTGTGKTTVAAAFGNEYLKKRIIEHSKGEREIKEQPTLFVRVAEFQNSYNKQFRGTIEEKEEAASRFSRLARRMEHAELLIMDDISLRSSTESMTNILYEILDERYVSERPVIFTSNFPIEKIGELLNPQIQSRIEGMTEKVAFHGKDYRKGGIL